MGVSPSLVSQIELDRVNPSVSTLYAIVTELGMTMSDVFGEQPEERVVQRGDGLAERPETRPVINLASGVRWERLTHERDPDVEFLYVVYPVGAASCPEDALMTHGGREYGYVTSGTLGVQVGFEVVRARSGRLDRLRFVLTAPAVGRRRRARPCDLGRHRPRGRSADDDGVAAAPGRGLALSLPALLLAGLEAADTGPARAQAGEKLGALVEHERQQDQHADRHLGVLRRLVEQREDVVDQREEERRQQRARRTILCPPARLAPPRTAAAMLSSPKLPMSGEPIWTWAARKKPASDAITEQMTNARNTMRPVAIPSRRDDVSSRPTASEREARTRAIQPHVAEDGQHHDDDEGDRNEADAPRETVDGVAGDGAFGVIAEEERRAFEDAERPERRDDRRKLEDADEHGVEDPGRQPHRDITRAPGSNAHPDVSYDIV